MIEIISQSNDFLKNCGLTYAFCGGYALELFLNKTLRSHSDVDIVVFEEDKSSIIKYILSKGWNIYEHKLDWSNDKSNSYLQLIQSPNDEKISHFNAIWAIKPDCSLVKVKPKLGENNKYDYEILNKEQLNFDFFEIIFNKRENGNFVIDSFSSQNKYITRELDKAILYSDKIPYLAPEIILLMISNPAYLKSDYHREKNIIDFNSSVPFLPKDNRDWLIDTLEIIYPEGLKRLEYLKQYNM